MVVSCNICKGDFKTSPDSIILCNYKDGAVHLGCCIHKCSFDNKPCQHALSTYDKLEPRY